MITVNSVLGIRLAECIKLQDANGGRSQQRGWGSASFISPNYRKRPPRFLFPSCTRIKQGNELNLKLKESPEQTSVPIQHDYWHILFAKNHLLIYAVCNNIASATFKINWLWWELIVFPGALRGRRDGGSFWSSGALVSYHVSLYLVSHGAESWGLFPASVYIQAKQPKSVETSAHQSPDKNSTSTVVRLYPSTLFTTETGHPGEALTLRFWGYTRKTTPLLPPSMQTGMLWRQIGRLVIWSQTSGSGEFLTCHVKPQPDWRRCSLKLANVQQAASLLGVLPVWIIMLHNINININRV